MRFRQEFPEKIRGWERISANTFLGVCRALWNWTTLAGLNLLGVGTNLKFYIENGGTYNDITPIRASASLTDPFETVNTSAVVTVTDVAHGAYTGDYVSFTGADAVGGINISGEYSVTVVDDDTYTITHTSAATSSSTGGGSVTAAYQLNTGADVETPLSGYGAGPFGMGLFGYGTTTTRTIQLWSQGNFGEDLIFCYRGGPICHWDATNGVSTRGTLVSDASGALEVPATANLILVSDVNRFVFALGCPPEASTILDPMLIRWCDQEDFTDWKSAATNQAGSIKLSRGYEIVTGIQGRQEILVWTNEALYGVQYISGDIAWGAQILGDNISILSQNAAVYVNRAAYWMGKDQFYIYDGTVRPLRCDLRRFVYNDLNFDQKRQVHAGINEANNEIWWFYCTANSTVIDQYVIYNYAQDVWYYGTMGRTAWLDLKLRDNPIAATYSNNLVYHEIGLDDRTNGTPVAIEPFITSAPFDLEDGHHFMFIRRVIPDITFDGSTSSTPAASMVFYPMNNAGSDYNNPASIGGQSSATVAQGTTVNVEPFTEIAYVRMRGRQMVMKVSSSGVGTTWQFGTPRLDMRMHGRK